jgi:hypothetical protein
MPPIANGVMMNAYARQSATDARQGSDYPSQRLREILPVPLVMAA